MRISSPLSNLNNKTLKGLMFSVLLITSLPAFTGEYVECNYCSIQSDFIDLAESIYGPGPVPQTYHVFNYNTEVVWNVTVERDFEPDPFYDGLTSFATPGSIHQVNSLREVKGFFEDEEVVIPIDTPDETGYANTRQEVVHGLIAQSPVMITLASGLRKRFFDAIIGKKIIAIVIFPNGDVAKYHIINPAGGSLCCDHISGSSRNINGEVLNDNGSSTGSSGGSGDYVQPGGGSGTTITIFSSSQPVFRCWQIPTGVQCARVNT